MMSEPVYVILKVETLTQKFNMGHVKRKGVLEHAQRAQIQIIQRKRKVSSGPLLSFKHSVARNDSASGQ